MELQKHEEDLVTAIIATHIFAMSDEFRSKGLGFLALDLGRQNDPIRPEVLKFARGLLTRLWDGALEGKEPED